MVENPDFGEGLYICRVSEILHEFFAFLCVYGNFVNNLELLDYPNDVYPLLSLY